MGWARNYLGRNLLERTRTLESGNQAVELTVVPGERINTKLLLLSLLLRLQNGTQSMYSPCTVRAERLEPTVFLVARFE